MVLVELDIVSAFGLFAVFVIFVVGFYRRQRSRHRHALYVQSDAADVIRRRNTPSTPAANAQTEQPVPSPNISTLLAAPVNRPEEIVRKISSASGSDTDAVVDDSAVSASVPRRRSPLSSICSGCQCSMKLCECTIVLYRPSSSTESTPRSSPPKSDGGAPTPTTADRLRRYSPSSNGPLSTSSSSSYVTPARYSPTSDIGAGGSCRTAGRPVDGVRTRLLEVPRSSGGGLRPANGRTLSGTGSEAFVRKRNVRGKTDDEEVNANVISFANRMT